MSKAIIISNSNELVRVPAERVVYISSDGNYSTLVLHNETRLVFTMNLACFLKLLVQQLGTEAQMFIRVGKQLIINREYIYKINPNKQQLVLADMDLNHTFEFTPSREALRLLKEFLESELKEVKP
jgi:DNA-binding LytR/AlgR family response regulator